jgi:hypothetical protein
MRKGLILALLLLLLQAPLLAHADVGFNINVGGPPVVMYQPPDFLYPPELGFGVAVGVPYDLFYDNGIYYLYRGGGWYRASYYGDNWIKVRKRDIPPELRRYKIARIHQYRDREYRNYQRDHEHYRGQHFRPEGRGEEHREMRGPGEEHRDMRRPGGEEHRDMNERRDMRGPGHEEHQDMRERR